MYWVNVRMKLSGQRKTCKEVVMRYICKALALLVLVCLSVSLAGFEGKFLPLNTSFDPAPGVSPFPANRETVLSSITYQGWGDGWETDVRYELEYDSLGMATCVYAYSGEIAPGEYAYAQRSLVEYSPDYMPLQMSKQYREGEEWVDWGDIEFGYENDVLKWYISSALYYDGEQFVYGPIQQVAFLYNPNNGILDYLLEYTNFEGPIPHNITRYQYSWDAGSRPSEIIESNMWVDSNWIESTRTAFVYHNNDQTSHASYLRALAFNALFGFGSEIVIGLQPSLLLEKRTFNRHDDSGNWVENGRVFYNYETGTQLDSIDEYANDYVSTDWYLNNQKQYTYQNGYPVSETSFSYNSTEQVMLPSLRRLFGYAPPVAAGDPAAPALITELKVYPNPCNPRAGISFKLEAAGPTEIAVYNLKGQKVRALLNESASAGRHTLAWDGRDDRGNSLSAGVYLIRLRSGGEARSVKVALVK